MLACQKKRAEPRIAVHRETTDLFCLFLRPGNPGSCLLQWGCQSQRQKQPLAGRTHPKEGIQPRGEKHQGLCRRQPDITALGNNPAPHERWAGITALHHCLSIAYRKKLSNLLKSYYQKPSTSGRSFQHALARIKCF